MALTTCSDCSKEISTTAPACPHCGRPAPPLPAPKKKTHPFTWLMALCLGYVVLVAIFSGGGSSTSAPTSITASTPAGNDIPKKDGTYDARPHDLRELSRDWVFYRNRIVKYSREGNTEEAAKARASFEQISAWLTQYKDEDVADMITKAESGR